MASSMFRVNISNTSEPPRALYVPESAFLSALDFYKARLGAKEVGPTSTRYSTLRTALGFCFTVVPINETASPSRVRLSILKPADRERLARALSPNGCFKRTRVGVLVTDAYGVTWTIS